MSTDDDSFLAQIRTGIEQRVNEQIERHRRIDPNGDSRNIIDIQLSQEREKLERILEDEEDPNIARVVQVLIDEYLPKLAKELKRR